MKKRVFAVLLAVMLIVASFSTASAATAGISADKTELAVGEKVTVSVTIPAIEKKAATIQFNVNFDNKVVKLVEWNPIAEDMGIKGVGTEEWAGYEYDAETDGYVANFDLANNNAQYSATYIGKANSAAINVAEGITWTATFEAIAEGEANFELETFIVAGVDEATGSQASLIGEYAEKADATVKAAPCKHDWKETNRVESTCKDAGIVTYECSICGETKEETLELADHTWGEWTEWAHTGEVAEGEECKECTMTRTRTCSVCGEVETATKAHNDNPATGDTMMSVLFFAMAAMFVAGIVVVNKARKNA